MKPLTLPAALPAKPTKPAKTIHVKTPAGRQVPLKTHNAANQVKNMPTVQTLKNGGMVKGKC